jgi:hypothetical protein
LRREGEIVDRHRTRRRILRPAPRRDHDNHDCCAAPSAAAMSSLRIVFEMAMVISLSLERCVDEWRCAARSRDLRGLSFIPEIRRGSGIGLSAVSG